MKKMTSIALWSFPFCLIVIYFINFNTRTKTSMNVKPEQILTSVQPETNSFNTTGKINELCENGKKYVRFECKKPLCGGWSDRLRGIFSAYAWAILTKREFLIDIDFPCSLTSMVEPNVVKWNNNNIECLNYTSIRLDKVSNEEFSWAVAKINILEYHNDVNIITITNNVNWIDAFSRNTFLNQTILDLGYDSQSFKYNNLFRKFYNDFFKLVPSLQKRYEEFLQEAKPDNETKLICAQVRIGGARPDVPYDKQFTVRNNSKLYWNFIKENFLNVNIKQKYKIFITTDTESVDSEAIEEFGRENIVKIDGPFVHIDHEKNGNTIDCSRVDKVILDLHALQNCDIAIISRGGFGKSGVVNRIEPFKDFYRFQETIINQTNLTGGYLVKYEFKKIESYGQI